MAPDDPLNPSHLTTAEVWKLRVQPLLFLPSLSYTSPARLVWECWLNQGLMLAKPNSAPAVLFSIRTSDTLVRLSGPVRHRWVRVLGVR